MEVIGRIGSLKQQIKILLPKANTETAKRLNDTDHFLDLLENSAPGNTDRGFIKMNNDFAGIFNILNESDMPPTAQATDEVMKAKFDLELLLVKWMEVKNSEIKKLNDILKISGLPILRLTDQ